MPRVSSTPGFSDSLVPYAFTGRSTRQLTTTRVGVKGATVTPNGNGSMPCVFDEMR